MDALIGTTLLLVGICGLCFIAGLVVGVVVYDRATSRMARYQRTGRPEAVPHTPSFRAGSDGSKPAKRAHGQSVEVEAMEKAMQRVVDRGADELMSVEPALTKEEARAKAKRILEETGAFKVSGGIPSA